MTERAIAYKLTVRDQEVVLAALRNVGREGETIAKRLEAANTNTARGATAATLSTEKLGTAIGALGRQAATGDVSVEGMKSSIVALAGSMGGPLGAIALVGALSASLYLASSAFDNLSKGSAAAARALEAANKHLAAGKKHAEELATATGEAAEAKRTEAQATLVLVESEITRLSIERERLRLEERASRTTSTQLSMRARGESIDASITKLREEIRLTKALIATADEVGARLPGLRGTGTGNRDAETKSAGEKAVKERERIIKEIEKLEDDAAKKAEETKEQQIDRAAELELARYQKMLDEKKITAEDFARAEAALARRAEAEKAEIGRQALEKYLDDQVKAHERAAQEALRPWQRFGDDLASIFTDAISNGFKFDRGNIEASIRRFAGGMANQNIFNPLFAGIGMAQPIAGAQDSPLYALAKSMSSLGSGATIFGQPLFGGMSGTAGEQELVTKAAASAGQPVPGGTGLFGAAVSGGATGFGIGSIIGSLFPGKLNSANSQIGGTIGGTIGGAVGSIFGPIGSALGSIAGSLLGSIFGGLFGPKKPSVGPNSGAQISYRPGGGAAGNVAYVQGSAADNGGDVRQGASFADATVEAINRFTKATGAKLLGVGGLAARVFGDRFELGFGTGVSASGTDAEDVIKKALFSFIKRGDIFDFGDDPRVAQAIGKSGAGNLDDLLADIEFAKNLEEILEGLEATEDQLKAVKIAARDAAREQVKAITDFVDKANELGFASEGQQGLAALVDQLLDFSANPEEITESAKALAALAANFEVLRENAEKLGLTEARIAQAEAEARAELRRGFDEGIAQQILQIVDPVAAALAEFDKAAERRVREAEELGANLVEVERLNGLERQRVLEQAANASRSSLADFFDEVMFGALGGASPGVSLEGRRASFEAAAAQALAGDFSAQGRLPGLGRDFLEASRGFFASSEGFQADRDRVLAVVGSLLGTAENPVVAAINDNAQEDRRVFLQMLEELAALRAVTVVQAAAIASLESRQARTAA